MPPTSSSPIYLTIHPLSRRSLPFHVHTDVCKYYLCGLDVNMFKNTRSNDDLQRHISPEDFAKIQSDDLRADFNALSSPERAKSGYEMQTKRLLDVLIRECDSRIARQNAR